MQRKEWHNPMPYEDRMREPRQQGNEQTMPHKTWHNPTPYEDRMRKHLADIQRYKKENGMLRSKIKELEKAGDDNGLLDDPNLVGLKKSVKEPGFFFKVLQEEEEACKELDQYYRFYKEHTEKLASEPIVNKHELIELLEALINVIKTNETNDDYFTNDKQASSLNNRYSSLRVFFLCLSQLRESGWPDSVPILDFASTLQDKLKETNTQLSAKIQLLEMESDRNAAELESRTVRQTMWLFFRIWFFLNGAYRSVNKVP